MRCLLVLTSSRIQELAASSGPEFIIYSFKTDETSKGSPVWEASVSHENEVDAIRKAKAMYSSARYTRVEVRKKYTDSMGRMNDEEISVYGSLPGKTMPASMLLATAFLCVIVAGFITIFG